METRPQNADDVAEGEEVENQPKKDLSPADQHHSDPPKEAKTRAKDHAKRDED